MINNVIARVSLIDPSPDTDIRIQEAENHISWIFTRNIVYDTYQGSTRAVYKPDHINVYYNPFGTQLLFGANQISFSEWQASGQDKNSIIADLLFLGDVNQCDFLLFLRIVQQLNLDLSIYPNQQNEYQDAI